MAADVGAGTAQETEELLRASGGKPMIQLVFDLEADVTSIRSVGLDGSEVVRFLVRIGRALDQEAGDHRSLP